MSVVGFIGLGTMGRHMAKNLLKAGHRLVFFARREELAREFIAAGAERAATPADVARKSEFVITIVTADPQVKEVVLGPGGVIEGAAAGKILIDMSTVGPETPRLLARELAGKGMAVVDAPVSGGPWGAEAGTLTIMVGGETKDTQKCQEVFQAMGKNIFHVGPLGSGQTVKLINQMMGAGIMTLIGEAMVLAKAAGVDLNTFVDVATTSSGNSTVLEARGKKFLLANQYTPGFMADLMHKDLSLAIDLARQLRVPVPLSTNALQQYTAVLNQGYGESDFSAVVKIAEQAAGRKIVD